MQLEWVRLCHASGTFPGVGCRFPGIARDFSMRAGAWCGTFARRGCASLLLIMIDMNDHHHAHGASVAISAQAGFLFFSAYCLTTGKIAIDETGNSQETIGLWSDQRTDRTDGPETTDGPDGRTGRKGQTDNMDGPDGPVGPDGRTGAKK